MTKSWLKYEKHLLLLFEDLPLSQKQRWLDNWIWHIKTFGNHSFSVIHMLSHTRN